MATIRKNDVHRLPDWLERGYDAMRDHTAASVKLAREGNVSGARCELQAAQAQAGALVDLMSPPKEAETLPSTLGILKGGAL